MITSTPRVVRGLVGLLAVLSGAQRLMAEVQLPGLAVEFEGWRYIPLMEDDDVHSFVVLAANPNPLGENITSMWFIREGTDWSNSYAWPTPDQQAALTNIKHTLGLSDETDAYWPVDPSIWPDGSASGTESEPLATGVFEDDPMLPVIESESDPTDLLSVLVSAGWQASDAVLFKSATQRDQLLNGLAEGVVLELADEGSGETVIGEAIEDAVGGGGACTEHIVVTPPFGRTCTGTWTWTGWTTVPRTGGGCWVENHWTATVTETETRRLRKFYTNCTTCWMAQTRTRTGTTSLAEIDFNVACPPPPGYAGAPPSTGP